MMINNSFHNTHRIDISEITHIKQRPISVEEAKQIRLEILIEIDRFCKERSLTYFLAFGTLLGAVRHGGFIPWDDDCDIMMPRPDMEIFLKTYTNSKYRAISAMSGLGQIWQFGRIIDSSTCRLYGDWMFPGVNVEIYPIDGCPKGGGRRIYFEVVKLFQRLEYRLVLATNQWIEKKYWPYKGPECILVKLFIRIFYVFGKIFNYKKTRYVVIIFGNPYPKKAFNKDVFKQISMKFEGHDLAAPSGWRVFLEKTYGDYQQLPPIEQRVPSHGGEYYKL